MDFLMPLIIGLVVGLIVLFSLLSQLKSVSQKHEASDYVVQNSLHLNVRNDRLIDKHTERQMVRQAMPQDGSAGSVPMQNASHPQSSHSPGMHSQGHQQGGGLTIVDAPKNKH